MGVMVKPQPWRISLGVLVTSCLVVGLLVSPGAAKRVYSVVKKVESPDGIVCLDVSLEGSSKLPGVRRRDHSLSLDPTSDLRRSVDDTQQTFIKKGIHENVLDYPETNLAFEQTFSERMDIHARRHKAKRFFSANSNLDYPVEDPKLYRNLDTLPKEKAAVVDPLDQTSGKRRNSTSIGSGVASKKNPISAESRKTEYNGLRSRYPLLQPVADLGSNRHRATGSSHGPSDANRHWHAHPLVEVTLIVVANGVHYTAGNITVNSDLLVNGLHTLSFKHLIVQRHHSLQVTIDGQSLPFLPSAVRRYPEHVYSFAEIQIEIKGPVSFEDILLCQGLKERASHLPSPTRIDIDKGNEANPGSDEISQASSGNRQLFSNSSATHLSIISNRNTTDEVLSNVYIFNSTFGYSHIRSSVINGSNVYHTKVDASHVIGGRMRDCVVTNSSLYNVTLENCRLVNTITFFTFQTNVTSESAEDDKTKQQKEQILDSQENLQKAPTLSNKGMSPENETQGLDAALLVLGILGLISLIFFIVGVVVVLVRHVVKKRREMLLVRSAVMGTVRSW